MSRQQRWRQKKIAEGKCAQCGSKRENYAVLCDACAIKRRELQRRLNGWKPKQAGKRGRPLKIPEKVVDIPATDR